MQVRGLMVLGLDLPNSICHGRQVSFSAFIGVFLLLAFVALQSTGGERSTRSYVSAMGLGGGRGRRQ